MKRKHLTSVDLLMYIQIARLNMYNTIRTLETGILCVAIIRTNAIQFISLSLSLSCCRLLCSQMNQR